MKHLRTALNTIGIGISLLLVGILYAVFMGFEKLRGEK